MQAIRIERNDRPKVDRSPLAPAIAARGLTKAYGSQKAVDDLGFEVGWGKVTGFLGPNGAGKTTTLRMVLGLATPTSGTATVLGRRYAELENPTNVVGAALETGAFHPSRTGRNHLRVLAAIAGIGNDRIDEVLALVDLTDAADKRVGKFSLGMRQRLLLAAALLGDPDVLILDEPANGLDPAGIRWLRGFLRSFADDGKAVFVSSHLLAELAQMVDEIIVIHRGKLVAHAPIEELTRNGGQVVKVRSSDPEQLRVALVGRGFEVRNLGPDELSVRGTTTYEVGTAAAEAQVVIYELEAEAHSLEDAFFELTNRKENVR